MSLALSLSHFPSLSLSFFSCPIFQRLFRQHSPYRSNVFQRERFVRDYVYDWASPDIVPPPPLPLPQIPASAPANAALPEPRHSISAVLASRHHVAAGKAGVSAVLVYLWLSAWHVCLQGKNTYVLLLLVACSICHSAKSFVASLFPH